MEHTLAETIQHTSPNRLRWDSALLLAMLLAATYMAYIVARALLLPITIDEASTCMNSVLPRTVMEVITYSKDPVPNNHVLNTLGIKLFSSIFGLNHLTARLPAILGGALYIIAAFGLALRLSDRSWVRGFAVVMLLANHFMMEFFGLARGYGLACGLMLAAIWQGWIFLEEKRIRPLIAAALLAVLSVESSFTLLNFFLPFMVALLLLSDGTNRLKTAGIFGVAALLTAVLVYGPLNAITSTDQLKYWGSISFLEDTLKPFIEVSFIRRFPEEKELFLLPMTGFVLLVSVLGWVWWCIQLIRKKALPKGFHLAVMLFAGTVLTNILQAWILHVPYLNPRTALFFYPLWALQLAVWAAWGAENWKKTTWVLTGIIGTFFAWYFYRNINLIVSTEWYVDNRTFEVLHELKTLHQQEQPAAPYTLDVTPDCVNSYRFHAFHANWPDYTPYVKIANWHGHQPPQMDTEFFVSYNPEEEAVLSKEYSVFRQIDYRFKLWRKNKTQH